MTTTEPNVELEAIARDQAAVLQNLFEYYVYDFSEHMPLELNPNGRFGVAVSDKWWTDGHFAFFVRHRGTLCGFALASRGSRATDERDVFDVGEFFIVRRHRRNRVGERAAHARQLGSSRASNEHCRQTILAARRRVVVWTSANRDAIHRGRRRMGPLSNSAASGMTSRAIPLVGKQHDVDAMVADEAIAAPLRDAVARLCAAITAARS